MFSTSSSLRRHAIRVASFVVLGLIRFANVQAATVCTSIAAQLKSAFDDSVSQTQPYMITELHGSYRATAAPDFAVEMPATRGAGRGLVCRARAATSADPESGLQASASIAQVRGSGYVTRVLAEHRVVSPSRMPSGSSLDFLRDDGVAKPCSAYPHHTDSFHSPGDSA